MIDYLLQLGLSNACMSLALAILAMVVGVTFKRPHLAHLLWLLVLIKLVTPPVVTIPVIAIPGLPETAVALNNRPFVALEKVDTSLWSRIEFIVSNYGREGLVFIWLLGSVIVFAWSLVRVYRFNRLLKMESEVAPQELQAVAAGIANRLELKPIPKVYTTSAHLSPMIWWIGGKVQIVIPSALLDRMDESKWQWIVAHELAHVRRRDYMVRWIEWLACVGFWWNPVVWWAGRNLRAMEEICCDALVMSCLKAQPQSYADSLLAAVGFLACPAVRPPAMASEINSGGYLKRRFKMIVSGNLNRKSSRWLQACVLLCVVAALPLGLAIAGDGEHGKFESVAKKIQAAVEAGEMTEEEGHAKLAAYKQRMHQEQKDKELRAKYDDAAKKIQAAVEAGELTKEEGHARLAAYKQRLSQEQKAKELKAKYNDAAKRIQAAVEAGEMTKEEGHDKLAAYKQRLDREQKAKELKAKYNEAAKKLQAAVERGDITREEADAKLAQLKKEADAEAEDEE